MAGPASRKTSTAPGLNPLSANAAAMGVEDAAQVLLHRLDRPGLVVGKDAPDDQLVLAKDFPQPVRILEREVADAVSVLTWEEIEQMRNM